MSALATNDAPAWVPPAALNDVAPYAATIAASAAQYGLDPNVVASVIDVESGGNPSAVSYQGANDGAGIAQFSLGTGIKYGLSDSDRYDPNKAIPAEAHLLSDLLAQYGGDLTDALAAYNGGDGAVQYLKAHGTLHGYAPYTASDGTTHYQTEDYVAKVNADLAQAGSITTGTGAGGTAVSGTAGSGTSGSSGGTGDWLSNLEQFAFTIEQNTLLGSLGLALIAGGFVWLAASNPGVRKAVAGAAEVAA